MLSSHKLIFGISLENRDETPFPAGIGLHPYFSNAKAAKISFTAKNIWACDADLIPTHSRLLTHNDDFSTPRNVQGLRFDNCFEDWDGTAHISWEGFPGALD